jgi:PAS domain S-box-containing protein
MKEEEERAIEKLSKIEKAINEMLAMREQVIELRESETQRQQGIEVLRASEKQYRTLIENLPQKLFLKDRNSVYMFCNQNYAADLKIKPEEISGKTDYEFFPKELAEKYISTDQEIMDAGQLENIEEKYIHNGETSIVHMVKTPVRDERGEPVGILGIFWDITEQKRNEEEMKKTGFASKNSYPIARLNSKR